MATSTKRTWRLQEFVAHESNVNCLALGKKSGRVMVTGGDDKKVNLWAVGKPGSLLSLTGHSTAVQCVEFGISEALVCAGSQAGALKIFDLESSKLVRTLTGHKLAIRCIDFHPYGDFLATGSLDGTVRLWDVRRKVCIYTYPAHKPRVNSAKFSPDGQWVASAGEEGAVRLWDLRKGCMLKEFSNHGGPVTSVTFHPSDFLLASTSADRTVNFWDLERFQLISSTEPDISGVRCAMFSHGGECLFAGSQDRLRVYGWEPTRTYDTLPINWGKVHNIVVANNQLLGASFSGTMVVVNVVDLSRVQPFSGPPSPSTPSFSPGQSVRKSFSRPKLKDQPQLAVNSIEEGDRSEPEDEAFLLADSQSVGDYPGIFQPNRKLCRTPPLEPFPAPLESLENDPSLPQILQPLSPERPESSDLSFDSQHSSEPSLPVLRGANAHTGNVTYRRARTVSAASTSPTDEMSSFESLEPSDEGSPDQWRTRRQSTSQETSPALPDVDFPVRLSNIHHSPSEPALNRPYSSNSRTQSQSRPNLSHLTTGSLLPKTDPSPPPPPPTSVSPNRPSKRSKAVPPPLPVDITFVLKQPKEEKEEKEDEVFISMSSDKPTGLDLEEFLPRNYTRTGPYQSSLSDLSESEVLTAIVRGHAQVMGVLNTRQRSLQIVYSVYVSKGMKTAVDSALAMEDQGVIVDLLECISSNSSTWTLEICAAILPTLGDLLHSKFEMYVIVALNTLKVILRNFSSVIKSNVVRGESHSFGVDISAEERYQRCKKCHECLLPIRAFVLKRQTVQGKLGQLFREVSAMMEDLFTY